MIIFFSVILISVAIAFLYFQHPKFGKAPNGKRLERIKQSPNFKSGKFQNASYTPMLTEGYYMSGVLFDFLFKTFPRTTPIGRIPSVKTNLTNLPKDQDLLVWFGHSSYFIQLKGKRFLIDPVFSGNASPIPNTNRSFEGTDIYSVEDMPEIDYLLITHDHYDHLDYPTIVKLKGKVKNVVCGLGVGEHFEYWGFKPQQVIEKDWNESLIVSDRIMLHTAPARHFSGRGLSRNNTLWLSFVLQANDLKLYLGGDSGYDTHFADLGKKFGEFDLAVLDNGQYNLAWQAIHMLPEEGLQAAKDLKAKRLLPVHSSKFKLGNHPWDEPLNTITAKNAENFHCPIITPKIGELVDLNNSNQVFSYWWKEVND